MMAKDKPIKLSLALHEELRLLLIAETDKNLSTLLADLLGPGLEARRRLHAELYKLRNENPDKSVEELQALVNQAGIKSLRASRKPPK